jgi:hypothetical protein
MSQPMPKWFLILCLLSLTITMATMFVLVISQNERNKDKRESGAADV